MRAVEVEIHVVVHTMPQVKTNVLRLHTKAQGSKKEKYAYMQSGSILLVHIHAMVKIRVDDEFSYLFT